MSNNSEIKAELSKIPLFISEPFIRPDVVQRSFNLMQRNKIQPHGVSWSLHRKGKMAGHNNSSKGWGTGRAKARVPRVNGSGTGRAGQATIANFCRKGHMFSPILPWRRWHRFVPIKERNLALLSCFSASSIVPLVQSRGHILPEGLKLPLIVKDSEMEKAISLGGKGAKELLNKLGLGKELERCEKSKKLNKGRSRMRNRKYRTCSGPLIIHHFKKENKENINNDMEITSNKAKRAFGTFKGISTMSAISPNLLRIAPGGRVGRLIVWTETAIKEVENLFDRLKSENKISDYEGKKILNNNEIKDILKSPEVIQQFNKEESVVSQMTKLMQGKE